MLGRTHFFIGISAALAVMQPSSMPTLVAGAGAAAIGGMISDIDSGTSQAHREADKIMTAAIAVTAIVILADYKFHVGIYERLMRNSSIARLLTGAMAFIIICTYGSSQPHRSFMHSFFIPVHAHGMHRCDLPGCRPLFCRCLRFPSGTGSVKLQASATDLAYEAWLFPGVLFFPRAHQPPAHVRRNGLCRPGTGHFYPRKTAGRADFFFFTFLNNDF